MRARVLLGFCPAIVAVANACSADSDASSTGFADGVGGSTFIPGGNGAGGSSAATGGTSGLPPEVEIPVELDVPQAGNRFVYAPNPPGDTVAVIDATALSVQSVSAGDEPTFVQTLAGQDAAVVLNLGTSDATVIRTATSGVSTTTRLKVAPGSNALAVDPTGAHAIVYFDETRGTATSGSFQDVTVLSFAAGADRAVAMTVGFRPSRIFFSSDGTHGYAVTEDGVSVIDLASTASGIARTVPLGGGVRAQNLDVSVTSDGKFALARDAASSELRLVDLDSGQVRVLDLSLVTGGTPDAGVGTGGAPSTGGASGSGGVIADSGLQDGAPAGPDAGSSTGGVGPSAGGAAAVDSGVSPSSVPTDVDLSPNGSFALAVVRSRSLVLRIPIPGGFDAPQTITKTTIADETIGSVTISPGARYALLYTTADITSERLTILDLASNGFRSVQLRKSIRSVAVSPDDGTAFAVHHKVLGDPQDPSLDADARLDRQYGFSVVQLATGFPKLQVTSVDPGPATIVPDGSHLLVLFRSSAVREVQNVDLESFLVTTVGLGSPPTSIGAVPGSGRVFVGQDHPDGRISFVDWQTSAIQTVTGFELNSRIRQ